ncbi:hypothetical protein ACWD6R_36910 [Streptomyces sp. NPDC005151]
MSSAALAKRLLDEHDLGEGYSRKPESTKRHDDVTVIGRPALAELGEAAAGAARHRHPLRPGRLRNGEAGLRGCRGRLVWWCVRRSR